MTIHFCGNTTGANGYIDANEAALHKGREYVRDYQSSALPAGWIGMGYKYIELLPHGEAYVCTKTHLTLRAFGSASRQDSIPADLPT
jgi:hypothetical protein